MLIVCPSCASSYVLDDARIGPAGRRVRCASCRDTFFVAPSDEEASAFPADPEQNQPELPDEVAFADTVADSTDSLWNDVVAEQTAQTTVPDLADDPAAQPDEIEAEWTDPAAVPDEAVLDEAGSGGDIEVTSEAGAAPGKAAAAEPKAARGTGRRKAAAGKRWRLPVAAMLALGILTAAGGLVLARTQVVRALPETAALYAAAGMPVNLRGLTFQDVRSELVREGEARLLVVEGEIANINKGPLAVPVIAIGVMGEGAVPLYRWTIEPEQATLAAGERTRFKARLVSPPQEGRQVLVRFTDAGDAGSVPARTETGDARLSGTDTRGKQ